ncbi:MAG: N-6 DNA methylase [Nanoarchaeota archaeon]|nr:N-6 DNA methylase [Nanoarchaeota archaeon]
MKSKQESKLKKLRRLVKDFEEDLKDKFTEETSEIEVQITYLNKLFDLFGWDASKKYRGRRREVRINITENGTRADYTFFIKGVTKFVIEAKKANIDIYKNEILMQAQNYALNAGVSWAIITNFKRFIVLDIDIVDPIIKKKIILDVNYDQYCEKYAFERLNDFSKEFMEKNILEEKQNLSGRRRKKKTINIALMKEILEWRKLMFKDLKKKYKLSEEELEDYILEVLNRLIFIRSCEDKGYMNHETLKLSRKINIKKNKSYLKDLFEEYEGKYDGHLFKKIDYRIKIDPKLLSKILYHLNISKDRKIKFDFKVISIDVLGTVYEEYLGQVTSGWKKTTKDLKSRKKKEGIYYTPNYIVRSIVDNTLLPLLRNKGGLDKITILDPACGSGSFLITAFKLILESKDVNLTYDKKVNLIKNHLFGIDKDPKAVEITKLNLCLSLIEEKDHDKPLPDLKPNVVLGNSLTEFESIRPHNKFSIILTNPPYGADFSDKEKKEIKNIFSEIYGGEIESYALFYYMALKYLKEGGYLGFITPDTWLTNKSFYKLREYFLKEGVITKIIDTYKPFPHAKDVRCHVIILKKIKKSAPGLGVKITHIDPYTCRKLEPKIKKEYLVDWSYFKKRGKQTWHPYQNEHERKIVRIITKNSESLDINYDVIYGLRTGDNKKYKVKTKTNIPLISGNNFDQYNFKKIEYYLKRGKFDKVVEPYLKSKKLVVQYVRTNKIDDDAPWLEAMIAPKKSVGLNSTNMIFSKNKKYSIKFLLGLLNSRLINWYYRLHYTDVNVKTEYLKLLPLPKNLSLSQIKNVEKLVDLIVLYKKNNNTKAVDNLKERLEIFLFRLYHLNYNKHSKFIFYS